VAEKRGMEGGKEVEKRGMEGEKEAEKRGTEGENRQRRDGRREKRRRRGKGRREERRRRREGDPVTGWGGRRTDMCCIFRDTHQRLRLCYGDETEHEFTA
jgi:hypothetical protein